MRLGRLRLCTLDMVAMQQSLDILKVALAHRFIALFCVIALTCSRPHRKCASLERAKTKVGKQNEGLLQVADKASVMQSAFPRLITRP